MCLSLCPQGRVWHTPPMQTAPGQTPPLPRQTPPSQVDNPPGRQPWADPPPPSDGHCSRWYASYWNAFLFMKAYFSKPTRYFSVLLTHSEKNFWRYFADKKSKINCLILVTVNFKTNFNCANVIFLGVVGISSFPVQMYCFCWNMCTIYYVMREKIFLLRKKNTP